MGSNHRHTDFQSSAVLRKNVNAVQSIADRSDVEIEIDLGSIEIRVTEYAGNVVEVDLFPCEFRSESMPKGMRREVEREFFAEFRQSGIYLPMLDGVPEPTRKSVWGFGKGTGTNGKESGKDRREFGNNGNDPILSSFAGIYPEELPGMVEVKNAEVYQFVQPEAGIKVNVNDRAVPLGNVIRRSRKNLVGGVKQLSHLVIVEGFRKHPWEFALFDLMQWILQKYAVVREELAILFEIDQIPVVRLRSPTPIDQTPLEKAFEILLGIRRMIRKGNEIVIQEKVESRPVSLDGIGGSSAVQFLFKKEIVDEGVVVNHGVRKYGTDKKSIPIRGSNVKEQTPRAERQRKYGISFSRSQIKFYKK